ncbi:MAG: hypothetical protein ACJ78Q_06960 [Chloroflexia bacterium]
MLCLSLAWAWLVPRLQRRTRLVFLGLLGALAMLALAVTALLPHDYRPGDAAESSLGVEVLGTQLLVAMAGVTAALAAIGRRRTLNARLFSAGMFLAGVGLCLYLILGGQSSVHAPALVFVGSAVAVAAASRLSGLPRWPARALGLATGLAVAVAVEALRYSAAQGAGPAATAAAQFPLLEIGAIVLVLAGVRFLRSHRRVIAGSLGYAAVAIAGTALALLLRGPGEWAPTPRAATTTLYGLPLTLLAVAVTLIILEQPRRTSSSQEPVRPPRRPSSPRVTGWAPAVALAALVAVAAVWNPVPEPCTSARYSDASARAPGHPAWAVSPDPSAPRGAPEVPEFDRLCTHRAQNLSQIVYIASPNCKWAEIDPDYPLVQASGTLRQILVSSADSPWLHTSHDLGMELAVDPSYSWLVLGTGVAGSLLHVEAESGPFPAAYWPVPGDRVTVAGRWIFDCGHDPKTELHPAAIVASEHEEWRPNTAGDSRQVHVLKVWMNSTPGVVHVPLAPFDLSASFPSRRTGQPGTPEIRLAAGSPGSVRWVVNPGTATGSGPQATIHITPPATAPGASGGYEYFELLLGYREPVAAPPPPSAYVVALDSLSVRDNLRSAARDTTGIPALYFPQIGLLGSGHWNMKAMVGHEWRSLLADAPVASGQVYPLNTVPPVRVEASGDGHLHFSITGYAENDPSDGVQLASGSVSGSPLLDWDAGPLDSLCCGRTQTITPQNAAWTLSYHVSRASP